MSDQELEEVSFNIILSSRWWKTPPKVKIWLNDELIETTVVEELKEKSEQKHVSFNRKLSEGEHSIIVELFGKNNDETVTDIKTNEIINDQLLHVEDIEIDEITLGYLMYKKSIFYTDTFLHPYAPAEIPEMTTTGYNGKLVIKFQVPTYIWFLENL